MKISKLNYPDSGVISHINDTKDHIGDTKDVTIINDGYGTKDYLDSKKTDKGIEIRSSAKDSGQFLQHYPYIVGHIVANRLSPEESNSIQSEISLKRPLSQKATLDTNKPTVLDSSTLSPVQKKVAGYAAKSFSEWRATKPSIAFSEYLDLNPPGTYLERVLQDVLKRVISQKSPRNTQNTQNTEKNRLPSG
jgi:hypothetical protein